MPIIILNANELNILIKRKLLRWLKIIRPNFMLFLRNIYSQFESESIKKGITYVVNNLHRRPPSISTFSGKAYCCSHQKVQLNSLPLKHRLVLMICLMNRL